MVPPLACSVNRLLYTGGNCKFLSSVALKANSDAHSDARTLAAAAILCEGPTESRMRSSSSLRFCSCDALSYLQTFKGMRE